MISYQNALSRPRIFARHIADVSEYLFHQHLLSCSWEILALLCKKTSVQFYRYTINLSAHPPCELHCDGILISDPSWILWDATAEISLNELRNKPRWLDLYRRLIDWLRDPPLRCNHSILPYKSNDKLIWQIFVRVQMRPHKEKLEEVITFSHLNKAYDKLI